MCVCVCVCVCVHVAFEFSGAKMSRFDYVRPKRMTVVLLNTCLNAKITISSWKSRRKTFLKNSFFHFPSCYQCTVYHRRTCHQIYQPGIWCQLISLIHVWPSSIQPTTKLCSIICWLYFHKLSRSSLPFSPHFIRTYSIANPSSGVTSIIQQWSGLNWNWWSRDKVTDLLEHKIL